MKETIPIEEEYLRSQHPQMAGEPNHGLVLEPEEDARLRAKAEGAGLDYDLLKYNFEISHQVISPKPHQEGLDLMDKNAVPLNALPNYFAGMIEGAVGYTKLRKKEA